MLCEQAYSVIDIKETCTVLGGQVYSVIDIEETCTVLGGQA